MSKRDSTSVPSSGNVFADLDLPDAEDLMAKANLALHIKRTIEARKLTQCKPPACSVSTSPRCRRSSTAGSMAFRPTA